MLGDPKTSQAFDVENADPKTLARYGKNKFGLSALMGFRLIDAGVDFVQINLGKNSSSIKTIQTEKATATGAMRII